tara:strand:+ start:948 stop:1400 length:453 start_codon:yes stop_codon:yes gene_type:complete
MRIVTDKNKIETKCKLVYFKEGLIISKKLISVCLTGKNKDCIGLAHNQIGGDKFVFVAKLNNKWRSFINAEIVSTSEDYIIHSESCMSFPNKFNKVKRFNSIIIKHQIKARNDSNGDAFITEEFNGMNSFIIQHEIDHLNGIHIFNKEDK